MSKLFICAVRDSAVDAFGIPVFVRAVGEAMRGFMDEVNRVGSPMNSHPSDYVLFSLGTYDDSTGEILCIRPEQLMRAVDAARIAEQRKAD